MGRHVKVGLAAIACCVSWLGCSRTPTASLPRVPGRECQLNLLAVQWAHDYVVDARQRINGLECGQVKGHGLLALRVENSWGMAVLGWESPMITHSHGITKEWP